MPTRPLPVHSLAWLVLLGCLTGCGSTGPPPAVTLSLKPMLTPIQADDDGQAIVARGIAAYGGRQAFERWEAGSIRYVTPGAFVPVEWGEAVVEDTFSASRPF